MEELASVMLRLIEVPTGPYVGTKLILAQLPLTQPASALESGIKEITSTEIIRNGINKDLETIAGSFPALEIIL